MGFFEKKLAIYQFMCFYVHYYENTDKQIIFC